MLKTFLIHKHFHVQYVGVSVVTGRGVVKYTHIQDQETLGPAHSYLLRTVRTYTTQHNQDAWSIPSIGEDIRKTGSSRHTTWEAIATTMSTGAYLMTAGLCGGDTSTVSTDVSSSLALPFIRFGGILVLSLPQPSPCPGNLAQRLNHHVRHMSTFSAQDSPCMQIFF